MNDSARILVVDADQSRAREVVGACKANTVELIKPTCLTKDPQFANYDCDLALTSTEFDHFDVVMSCHAKLGYPEVAFYATSEKDPAFSALKLLCPERLVLLAHISEWLTQAVEPLTQLCRARKLERQARLMMERVAIPAAQAAAAPVQLSLYAAEGHFRETYLRAVLSSSSSCREAALKAGLPYRTFMYMINRLGVRDSEASDVRRG